MRKILFYKTMSGDSPIERFLDGLGAKQAQRVAWVLKIIEDLEMPPSQYLRKMAGTKELWEVRVWAAPETYRLLGFFDGPHLIVLAHAFSKKSQKVPLHAIRLAERRRSDYFARKKK